MLLSWETRHSLYCCAVATLVLLLNAVVIIIYCYYCEAWLHLCCSCSTSCFNSFVLNLSVNTTWASYAAFWICRKVSCDATLGALLILNALQLYHTDKNCIGVIFNTNATSAVTHCRPFKLYKTWGLWLFSLHQWEKKCSNGFMQSIFFGESLVSL